MQSKEKKAVEGEPRLTPTSPNAMQAISALHVYILHPWVAPVRAVQPARGRNTCRGVLSGPSRKDDRAGATQTSENRSYAPLITTQHYAPIEASRIVS